MARGGWSRPLSGFAREIEGQLSQQGSEMVLFALQQLIMHSPVSSGAYRGSHFVTVDNRDTASVPNNAPGEAERQAEMLLSADSKPFKQVFIQSNIAYGERIENGWSQQAPSGVYAVAENSTRERFR